MPLFPCSSYIALAFLIGVVGLMAYFPDTRIALIILIIGPIWFMILTAFYYGNGLHKRNKETIDNQNS